MTSPHTDKTSVLAVAIKNKILSNQVALGLNQVLYGNHNMVNKQPAAVIIPSRKRRILAGVSAPGGRTENELNVYIDILTQDVKAEEEARLAIDQIAEAVETVLHSDPTMGGIIIHGFVTDWDPGERFVNDSQFRQVRMYYTGRSKTYLSA